MVRDGLPLTPDQLTKNGPWDVVRHGLPRTPDRLTTNGIADRLDRKRPVRDRPVPERTRGGRFGGDGVVAGDR